MSSKSRFVSRGGLKLEHALKTFGLNVTGSTVLDVGSSTGGFVDCLLQNGAAKIYSVDTAYGELAWKLRQDPRVIVIERQNILFLENLPQKVDLVTIDVTFTSLEKVLAKVAAFLKRGRKIISLLKPQYQDQKFALKNRGVIPEEFHQKIITDAICAGETLGLQCLAQTESPILGGNGNIEFLLLWL